MFTLEKLGPQRDSKGFTKKARLLQSYYRCSINEPCGVGPKKTDTLFTGSMISNGEKSGKNFLLIDTFEYAKQRVASQKPGETIDSFRLFNNLLSSMPLCFNLFHPLMLLLDKEPKAVANIFRALFPESSIDTVEKIEIELAPTPITKYTDDKTGLDAVIECRKTSGAKLFIAIETKYNDKLGENAASNNQTKYTFAKELRYFNETGLAQIAKGGSQIYRNFLLAEKYAKVHGFEDCLTVILGPSDDSDTFKKLQAFKEHLKPEHQNRIMHICLEDFWRETNKHVTGEFKNWADDFYNRYLNFKLIEPYM